MCPVNGAHWLRAINVWRTSLRIFVPNFVRQKKRMCVPHSEKPKWSPERKKETSYVLLSLFFLFVFNINLRHWFPSRQASLILPSWPEQIRRDDAGAAYAVVFGSPFIPKRFARDETKSPHLRKLRPKVVQLALTKCPRPKCRSAFCSHAKNGI